MPASKQLGTRAAHLHSLEFLVLPTVEEDPAPWRPYQAPSRRRASFIGSFACEETDRRSGVLPQRRPAQKVSKARQDNR